MPIARQECGSQKAKVTKKAPHLRSWMRASHFKYSHGLQTHKLRQAGSFLMALVEVSKF